MKKLYPIRDYIQMLAEADLLAEAGSMPQTGGVWEREVLYLSNDSRDIKDGTLFVCKGEHFTQAYLDTALDCGAFAYVSEVKYEGGTADGAAYILVTDIRKAMALLADMFYGRAWKRLQVIGLTGTKGKSTTTYFLKSILDDWMAAQGKPETGVISSIDTYDGVVRMESHLTTPESMDLHRHFFHAAESGMEYLTMEVSSQALKYDRVQGVRFACGCFLNIGIDHISSLEHADFEDYFTSKLRIFQCCDRAAVNLESDYADRVLAEAVKQDTVVMTFGLQEEADVYGHDVMALPDGIAFTVRCRGEERAYTLSMHGLFNVENALCAITVCKMLGVPDEYVVSGLARAGAAGRMELFVSKSGKRVFVDYAHNKMSFETLFESTRKEFPGCRMVIVFGCPGRKALGRRRELGQAAGNYCDKVYVTEEDYGEEPIGQICEQIATHVREVGGACEILYDRREAILKAIAEADANTVVLLTGKGRETRMKRGMEYIDTPSDVDYVNEAFALEEAAEKGTE